LNDLSNTNMFVETLFTDFMKNKEDIALRNKTINKLVEGFKQSGLNNTNTLENNTFTGIILNNKMN
jgi:hypothetical protein